MRVIKVGGRAQQDPALPSVLAAEWRLARGKLCVVHGGGEELSALQRRLGIEAVFAGGRRLTSREDIDLARMALSGSANKRLVSALIDAGVPAAGVSGEDGSLLVARRADASLGQVGTPSGANVALLRALLDAGFLPVVSPLARDADGSREGKGALNVNADDAAAVVAAELGAAELVLVSDVAGVEHAGVACESLDEREARELITAGHATGGMTPKLEAALVALAAGVGSVRIGDICAITNPALGTSIVAGLAGRMGA